MNKYDGMMDSAVKVHLQSCSLYYRSFLQVLLLNLCHTRLASRKGDVLFFPARKKEMFLTYSVMIPRQLCISVAKANVQQKAVRPVL